MTIRGLDRQCGISTAISSAAGGCNSRTSALNKTQSGSGGSDKPPAEPYAGPRVEHYHGNVVALVKEGVTDENWSKVVAAIRKLAQVI